MSAKDHDLVILGTGPAGLQAAIHAARGKVSVLVLGKSQQSSLFKAHVENYCCLVPSFSGIEMLKEGRNQAAQAGAQFREEDVIALEPAPGGGFLVRLESGQEIACQALILAMGVSRNRLGAPGEKELLGKGVSYCVDCDGGFFRGQPVAVVGGASAAVSGALTMLFMASQVHLVCQELAVGEVLGEKLKESAIVLHEGRKVKAIRGQGQVQALDLDDGTSLAVAGVFIELGAKGAVELAGGLGVLLDSETFKYIATDKRQATNLPGVFAAGDITGPPWQMAKAVGEGCVAGLEAAAYVKRRG
ncbi:MAG: FAD-dependent oxidoreductase [Desulfarculus sp.]|nr:FAD-dependent oxidoreductase [Desulfarculus sp.]